MLHNLLFPSHNDFLPVLFLFPDALCVSSEPNTFTFSSFPSTSLQHRHMEENIALSVHQNLFVARLCCSLSNYHLNDALTQAEFRYRGPNNSSANVASIKRRTRNRKESTERGRIGSIKRTKSRIDSQHHNVTTHASLVCNKIDTLTQLGVDRCQQKTFRSKEEHAVIEVCGI